MSLGIRRRALAQLAGAALLAACGEAAPPVGDVAADSAVVHAPADSAALRACDVTTDAELEGILAVELEPGALVNDYAGVSQCRWYLPGDRQRGVSISLYERGDLENYRRVPGSTAAAGIGDAAIWNEAYGQLAVATGERVLSVGLLVADPRLADAERIARNALARLSAPR